MKTAIIALVVVILLGIFGPQTLYTVDETQITVVRRFGDIKAVNLNPGIQVKAPFIDSVTKMDKRLLRVDIPEATLPDVELQFLVIDAYVRYKVRRTEADAIKFFEKTRGGNLQIAEERIERIVVSALREEVAKRQRQEIIGGRIQIGEDGQQEVVATETRQEILDAVVKAAVQATSPGVEGDDENDLGIEIVDVRMKRADFPDATIENIFTRMETERELISAGLRAEGAEDAAKITAAAERDRTIILAEAERSANLTRGEGEAKAIEIFADALQENPEFYAFQRSLEAYKEFLSTNATVILGSDSELFEFLQDTDFIPVELPVSVVDVIERLQGNLWTVGGVEVTLAGSTTISSDVRPEVGLSVFVEGNSDEARGLVASDVLVGSKGIVDDISLSSLIVNQQRVVVNEHTDVRAKPRVIATVYVEGVSEGGRVDRRPHDRRSRRRRRGRHRQPLDHWGHGRCHWSRHRYTFRGLPCGNPGGGVGGEVARRQLQGHQNRTGRVDFPRRAYQNRRNPHVHRARMDCSGNCGSSHSGRKRRCAVRGRPDGSDCAHRLRNRRRRFSASPNNPGAVVRLWVLPRRTSPNRRAAPNYNIFWHCPCLTVSSESM